MKAAGIGEDRTLPGHEAVQAAELGDALVAGAQVEVVGIGQDESRPKAFELLRSQRLDRRLSPHRSEDGRGDGPVGCMEGSSSTGPILSLELKAESAHGRRTTVRPMKRLGHMRPIINPCRESLSSHRTALILPLVAAKNGSSTWAEVSPAAIADNISRLRDLTRVPIMAVVKAEGYGHGWASVTRAAESAGAAFCAVARVDEALALRRAGVSLPVLVLGETPPSMLRQALDQAVSLTVFTRRHLHELADALGHGSQTATVHLKVDTGMSRLGAAPEDALDLLSELSRMERVQVDGLFTHFACADLPEAPSNDMQERKFRALLERIEAGGLRPTWVHAANSAAAISRPSVRFDLVRCGIAIYGIAPSDQVPLPAGFEPALAWKSRLVHVQQLPAGTGVSYGHDYITQQEERIGVVGVGYGDGYRRQTGGELLIRGARVPIVGRVCMDQVMVSLDTLPEAEPGDEVVLLGRQGEEWIRAEELARRWDTIPYEVLCGISGRVPRRLVNSGPAG